MAMDESTTPAGPDLEVDTERVLVRPYIDEYSDPPPDYEPDVDAWEDAPAPPLPRSRTRHLPGMGRMSRHRSGDREVPVGRHVLRRMGRRSTAVLAVGTALMIIGVVVIVVAMTTGGGVAAPGSSVADQASRGTAGQASGHAGTVGPAQPDGQSRPATTQQGAQRGAPTSTNPAIATPATGPATTGGTGSPPGAPGPPVPSSPGGGGLSPSPVSTSPPPAADLTGPITNVAGLCLSMASDGRVRLWDCDGSAGEKWTLAADGTIRVLDQCLRSGAGLVRLDDCDGSLAQQWRVTSAQSLVNVGSAGCLGDPQSGGSRGTPQRTAACDGSDAQRWAVPAAG
jgi:hypothetical protein